MILEEETFKKLGKNFEQASQKSKIVCKCDYCGTIFERLKHNIQRSWKISKNDSCNNKICVQKKRINSNQINFGTDNAFQNEKIKEKIVITNERIYGFRNPMMNKDIRAKQIKTCEDIHGVKNVFQSEKIKEKIKEKNKINLGVENPMQNINVRKKQQDKLRENFGVPFALQNKDLRKKAMDTCIDNHGKFPANCYGKTQKEIQTWLNSFGFNFISNRSLIIGSEIDLYDETKKIGIEYCGLHWHHELSPAPRDQNYHFNKYKKCLEQGVQLLTIFSDEWEKHQNQCKGHIKSILNINEQRIYARNCIVKEINKEVGRKFINDYHIQGKNNLGVVFFGLFSDSELCGVISLGRHNRQQSDMIVLDRLCFKDGIQIVGGASKLFSRCIKWAKEKNHKEILSFSDNRWSLGNVYVALNFEKGKEYSPDYSYVNMKSPTERLSKQSQKKSVVKCPENMTEYQWALERGLSRIWDCGKKRWIYKIKE